MEKFNMWGRPAHASVDKRTSVRVVEANIFELYFAAFEGSPTHSPGGYLGENFQLPY